MKQNNLKAAQFAYDNMKEDEEFEQEKKHAEIIDLSHEIQKNIIDDLLRGDGNMAVEAFIDYLVNALSENDFQCLKELKSVIAKEKNFGDTVFTINSLVVKSIYWKALELAKEQLEKKQ